PERVALPSQAEVPLNNKRRAEIVEGSWPGRWYTHRLTPRGRDRVAPQVGRLRKSQIPEPRLGVGRGRSPVSSSLAVVPMNEVTPILSAMEQGDPHAAEQLLPLVYDELRRLAVQWLAQEKPGQTLQATALVHEAYLRLVDVEKVRHWKSRGHFFAAAAEAMRHLLVDRARRKRSRKRGGDRARVEFDEANLADAQAPEEVLAVDEALAGLAT